MKERFLDLTCGRVRVLERDGDPRRTVVFLHGVTGSASTWETFLEALPDGLRGIAYDALGCGYTERRGPRGPIGPDQLRGQLLEVLDALEVERLRGVGCSMGCGACLGAAWRQPQRFGGLLLVSPAQLGRRRLNPTLRAARVPAVARALEWMAPVVVPPMASARLRAAAGRRPDPELRRRETGHALARPRQLVRGFIDMTGHADLRLPSAETAEWARIGGPVWILRGSRDLDWMPESHEDRYRGLIPGAELIRWEGAGHSPQIEAPDRFRTLLADFLAASQPGPESERATRGR